MLIETWFGKILKMSLQYFDDNFFYQNVFLSFYFNIVCKTIVCGVGFNDILCQIFFFSNLFLAYREMCECREYRGL